MSSLALLRHGVPAGYREGYFCGRTDVELSEEGWAQMWRATQGANWSHIVTSPLKRCAAFGKALAARLSIACEVDPRWQELHFGRWENRSVAEIHAHEPSSLARFWSDRNPSRPPGGETLRALRRRVEAARADLSVALPYGARCLVVTHAGPMRVLLCPSDAGIQELLSLQLPHGCLRTCSVGLPQR